MAITHDETDPTGIRDTSPRGSGQAHRARERKANSALALKEAGGSWEQIAEVLGYPSGRDARNAVELALERELKSEWSKKHKRTLNAKRLEKLMRSVWSKATDPQHPEHLAAVREARALLAQDAKLEGYEAPTEFVVSSPTVNEIEAWVNRRIASDTAGLPEADIFDTDIVDGEVVNDPSEESFTTVNAGEES